MQNMTLKASVATTMEAGGVALEMNRFDRIG
jgi:hypothetical protein